MPPDEVTLIDEKTGETISVPAELAEDYRGYRRETGVEEAARAEETELERAYGDSELAAGLEAGASALTFGGYDVLAGVLGAGEGVRERRKRSPRAALAGQILGDVAATVASGGTTLLAKSPAALAARQAEKFAARGIGKGALRRTGAAAVGYGAEGAMHAAGNYIGNTMLMENPEFSAEALLSSIKTGALFGAGGGAIASGVGGALDKVRGATGTRATRALEGMSEAEIKAAKAAVGEAAAPSGTLSYRRLIPASERTPARIGARANQVIEQVGEAERVLGAARTELSDLFKSDRALATPVPPRELREVQQEASRAFNAYGEAVASAREWQKSWTKDLAPDDLAKGKLPKLGEEASDRAVDVLGNLDDAAKRLEDVLARTRQTLAPEVEAAIPLRPEAAPPAQPSALGKIQDVAAVASLAGDMGLPMPDVRNIPVVGDAVSAYLKYRLARNSLAKVGLVSATPMVKGAAQVASVRDQVFRAVSLVDRPPVRRAGSATIRAAGRALSAAQVREIATADPTAIAKRVQAQSEHLPPEVSQAMVASATRQAEYLKVHAPRPPGAGTAFAPSDWQPSRMAMARFGARYAATTRPLEAIESLMGGAVPHQGLAIDAIKTVWPALFSQAQMELIERVDDLVKSAPRSQRERVGSLFSVPLTGSQLPQYELPLAVAAANATQTATQEASGTFGRPTSPSSTARLDEPKEMRRLMR